MFIDEKRFWILTLFRIERNAEHFAQFGREQNGCASEL